MTNPWPCFIVAFTPDACPDLLLRIPVTVPPGDDENKRAAITGRIVGEVTMARLAAMSPQEEE